MLTSPAAEPEIIVFMTIFEIPASLFANISAVDPPLKKSHDTHRIIVPTTTKGMELFSKSVSSASSAIQSSTFALSPNVLTNSSYFSSY